MGGIHTPGYTWGGELHRKALGTHPTRTHTQGPSIGWAHVLGNWGGGLQTQLPHPTLCCCHSQHPFLYPSFPPPQGGRVGSLFKIRSKLPLELDTPLAFCFASWEEGGGGAEGTGGVRLAHLATHPGSERDHTVLSVPVVGHCTGITSLILKATFYHPVQRRYKPQAVSEGTRIETGPPDSEV